MKGIVTSVSILFLLSSCGVKGEKKTDEDLESRKIKSALAQTLMTKYSIKTSFDTLNIRYSVEFDSEVGHYQMASANVRIIDLYKEDSTNYVSLSVGIPRKYLKLSLSSNSLKELLGIKNASGYISNKILVFKINKIKKIDFVLDVTPMEEYGYTVELLSGHNRNFIGEGELAEIVSIKDQPNTSRP